LNFKSAAIETPLNVKSPLFDFEKPRFPGEAAAQAAASDGSETARRATSRQLEQMEAAAEKRERVLAEREAALQVERASVVSLSAAAAELEAALAIATSKLVRGLLNLQNACRVCLSPLGLLKRRFTPCVLTCSRQR
jgi:hypothetical protein